MINFKETKMKYKLLFLCLSLSFIPFSPILALDASDNVNESNNSHMVNYHEPKAERQCGKILATLITINKNEIAAAKEALSRNNLNPMVKEFAQKLDRDHTQNLKATEELSKEIGVKPEESSLSISLKQKGHQGLAMLKTLDTQAFQVAYAKAMVKGHEGALKILDKGIENAKNPKLKKHLELTRITVEHHLKMSKMLEKKLRS